MTPFDGSLGMFIGGAVIVCLVSLLYWLREIGMDVSNTLPEDQRIARWGLFDRVPKRIHGLWDEHVKLFPDSRKRLYAALSMLLMFLIPITALIIYALIPS
jgi:hypothetical protein